MKLSAAEVESRVFFAFDIVLIVASSLSLILWYFFGQLWAVPVLAVLSFLGLVPVIASAIRSLMKKQVSVDLLASIALIFSLLSRQWSSAAFITLMLAFARVFDHVTQGRARKIIQSLMKFKVENVRLKVGESFKEVHVSQVKPGDLVVVDAGDRMPVDGTVVSGQAEADESSLTGESELVPKKPGDKVFTATMSESGSLVVRAEKIGADSTLSRIMSLVEEASRDKSRAERVADTFTQWYIGITLIASLIMYFVGLTPTVILSILLVVCADDIAVAVPLAFTSAIARTAKKGVVVKGSAAFEQLSRVKYMLTDKTGTLTRGKPQIVDIRAYGGWSEADVVARAAMGSSESKHAISRAIMEYARKKDAKVHAPQESQEISGQGVSFRHGGEEMFIGRLSYVEHQKIHIPEHALRDVELEKDAGRGVVILAVDGKTAGLISYRDELRPHVREIIAETKALGIREWHMLTGDNEHTAKAVAAELGIRHYHANMTPETKVEFIRHFEKEHSPKTAKASDMGITAYMGDGVNDAASLALVDVSIAMGGIGADSAIEAADITIMKDRLDRLPMVMKTARTVRNIMWQCFFIWAVTNAFGLIWVTAGIPGLGILGPSGAAAFNFLTDFIPIGNSLRAGLGRGKR